MHSWQKWLLICLPDFLPVFFSLHHHFKMCNCIWLFWVSRLCLSRHSGHEIVFAEFPRKSALGQNKFFSLQLMQGQVFLISLTKMHELISLKKSFCLVCVCCLLENFTDTTPMLKFFSLQPMKEQVFLISLTKMHESIFLKKIFVWCAACWKIPKTERCVIGRGHNTNA